MTLISQVQRKITVLDTDVIVQQAKEGKYVGTINFYFSIPDNVITQLSLQPTACCSHQYKLWKVWISNSLES